MTDDKKLFDALHPEPDGFISDQQGRDFITNMLSALCVAAPVLARHGLKNDEEAWAAYSHVVRALDDAQKLIKMARNLPDAP